LRYEKIGDDPLRQSYSQHARGIVVAGKSPTSDAIREELQRGLSGLLNHMVAEVTNITTNGTIVVGTPENSSLIAALKLQKTIAALGDDGYLIRSTSDKGKSVTVIASHSEIGALHGVFHFLRLLQTRQDIAHLNISERPLLARRLLNHWDNLNGSIERGYAGKSLWQWSNLPETIDPRYKDYARANASLGINGAVLNNVNASPEQLSAEYLKKAAALADVFRPYGIRVYLTANFASPKRLGGLTNANPNNPEVRKWWKDKADEIYKLIPDFGGFLVKANSEGQPGPQDYGLTHADGANMLGEALAPHGGVVMWQTLDSKIDPQRFAAVQKRLDAQLAHVTNWRDTCIRYFQSVNHKPLPTYLNQP
jgi:alpha-glucuronidase